MVLEDQLRNIAKSHYWQNLYLASQSINGVNLFNNKDNFSGLQSIFLYWLRVYNLVYEELAQKEWENLNEEIINDPIRLDAFLYWRSKEQEKRVWELKKQQKENDRKTKKKGTYNLFKGAQNKGDN